MPPGDNDKSEMPGDKSIRRLPVVFPDEVSQIDTHPAVNLVDFAAREVSDLGMCQRVATRRAAN